MKCRVCQQWNETVYRRPVLKPIPSDLPHSLPRTPVPISYAWDCEHCGATHLMLGDEVEKVVAGRVLEAAEDARLNALADERAGGPFVAVRLEDLG